MGASAVLALCACESSTNHGANTEVATTFATKTIALDSDSNRAIAAAYDGIYVAVFGGGELCPKHHCVLRLNGDMIENVTEDAPPGVFKDVRSLAVDDDGNIYSGRARGADRWSPASGETADLPLDLTEYDDVDDLGLTADGDLYAYISGVPRTVVLREGASAPETIELERGGTLELAAGRDGNVFLLDTYEPTVWKLTDGAWTDAELSGFEWPQEITVGPDGAMYLLDCIPSATEPDVGDCRSENAAERRYRILRYGEGETMPAEIPVELIAKDGTFTSYGLAVDDDGAIYVLNGVQIVKLTPE